MIATADLFNYSWSFEGEPSSNFLSLQIVFKYKNNFPLTFSKPLSFHVELFNDQNELIEKKNFPKNNTEYLQMSQSYLEEIFFEELRQDTEYRLFVFAKYGDTNFSKDIFVKTKRSSPPYPSWNYSETERDWLPPYPKPNDDYSYFWHEDGGKWVRILENDENVEYFVYDENLDNWVPHLFD